jgi:hypothetical protein
VTSPQEESFSAPHKIWISKKWFNKY